MLRRCCLSASAAGCVWAFAALAITRVASVGRAAFALLRVRNMARGKCEVTSESVWGIAARFARSE